MRFFNEKPLSRSIDLTKRKISSSSETHHIPNVKVETQQTAAIIKPTFLPPPRTDPPQKAVYYSIKYLGITKGQIGILSKRAVIPLLSSNETCKDVPLSIINTSLSSKRSNQIIKQNKNLERSTQESSLPEEYIIHTYARPKAFVSIKRPPKENPTQSPITITKIRTGISGWKLSKPKPTNSRPATSVSSNYTKLAIRGSANNSSFIQDVEKLSSKEIDL